MTLLRKYSTQILGLLVLTALCFSSAGPVLAAAPQAENGGITRYVATTGVDAGDCSDSGKPCRTLQYAVNKSVSGDTILVAEGTYTSHQESLNPCPSWSNSIVCYVDKSLTILGGYSAANWYSANPEENVTVIDGKNAHRGVTVLGYKTTTTHLTMEGFTIQNGLGLPSYVPHVSLGGGMWVMIATVDLKDVTFRNNRVIGENTNSGDGGDANGSALRIESSPPGTQSRLERVAFDGNQSIGGSGPDRGGVVFGALFTFKSVVTVVDSTFTNNLAQAGHSNGVGISTKNGLHADALGGAIAVENGEITLQQVVVTGNQIRGGNGRDLGGGAYGAGVFVEGVHPWVSSLVMEDSYVAENSATAGNGQTGGNAGGGGILATNSAVTIRRVKSLSNEVVGGSAVGAGKAGPGAGGGIYLFATQPGMPRATMENVVVADNYVAQGDGTHHLGNGGSAGIAVQGMNADILHATIAGNRMGTGLVLGHGLGVTPWYLQSGQLSADVYLAYSIVADHVEGGQNAAAIVVSEGTSLTLNQGLFSGNVRDSNSSGYPIKPGVINGYYSMSAARDAAFISPGLPDFNYGLRSDSPAVDQATGSQITDDVDGETRPGSGASDFGADEYWPFPLAVAQRDGGLHLDWRLADEVMGQGVDYYQVVVNCDDDGTPPDQGYCGETIYVGSVTEFTVTGLRNFMDYSVVVYARTSAGDKIATSMSVTAFPTNIFIFLPAVNR